MHKLVSIGLWANLIGGHPYRVRHHHCSLPALGMDDAED